jgi:GR25 family glycosyltransferase involved in LPS biosynthesis
MNKHFLNQIFDKVFVISYESNKKQHEYIEQTLGSRNIEYEIFMGADASKLGISLYDIGYLKRLPLTSICCSLSHYWLYLKLFQEKQNNFLILEDDIYFKREDLNLNEIEQIKNKNWDILYLGFNNSCSNYDSYLKSKLIEENDTLIKLNNYRFPYDVNIKLDSIEWNWYNDGKGKFFEGTSSIAIKNYETLDILINDLKNPEKLYVIDGHYNKLIAYDDCDVYALYPQIFTQQIKIN